jgi:hypothetical protein
LPDLIEFFVFKNVSATYIEIDERYNLSSDHSLILLTIREHVITKAQNLIPINKYTDWHYLNFLLETKIDLSVPLKTIDQLED